MAENTKIAWTDHTFNPWTGCSKVSPACANCYAESWAKRAGHPERWSKNGPRVVTSLANWRKPLRWNDDAARAGSPALVFCASLADVFEDHPDVVDARYRLFDLIDATPHLIWQLLTKRPENVLEMVPRAWLESRGGAFDDRRQIPPPVQWPKNVWIMTTAEDQRYADERIPELLKIPAPVRGVSFEPLLGPVVLDPSWLVPAHIACGDATPADIAIIRDMGETLGGKFLDWAIVGGESGPGHRPMQLDHARQLLAQIEAAGIPAFFKQVGGLRPTSGGDLLDGRAVKQFPRGIEGVTCR